MKNIKETLKVLEGLKKKDLDKKNLNELNDIHEGLTLVLSAKGMKKATKEKLGEIESYILDLVEKQTKGMEEIQNIIESVPAKEDKPKAPKTSKKAPKKSEEPKATTTTKEESKATDKPPKASQKDVELKIGMIVQFEEDGEITKATIKSIEGNEIALKVTNFEWIIFKLEKGKFVDIKHKYKYDFTIVK